MIWPWGSTASTPRHSARALPWRSTFTPPALVASTPPICAVPWDASASGNWRPALAAASRTCCRVAPASATITPSSGWMARMAVIRSSDRTSGTVPSGITCPPTSPVPPPRGTMATRASAQRRTTAATSSTLRGAAISPARPRNRPRGSSR